MKKFFALALLAGFAASAMVGCDKGKSTASSNTTISNTAGTHSTTVSGSTAGTSGSSSTH